MHGNWNLIVLLFYDSKPRVQKVHIILTPKMYLNMLVTVNEMLDLAKLKAF